MFLVLIILAFVMSTVSAAPIRYDLEHCYVDDISGSVGIIAKPRPKPDIASQDGAVAILQGGRHTSLRGTSVYIEYTSGWVILWRDAGRTVPALPTKEEYLKSVTGGSVGYLKGTDNCGSLHVA